MIEILSLLAGMADKRKIDKRAENEVPESIKRKKELERHIDALENLKNKKR